MGTSAWSRVDFARDTKARLRGGTGEKPASTGVSLGDRDLPGRIFFLNILLTWTFLRSMGQRSIVGVFNSLLPIIAATYCSSAIVRRLIIL